MEKLNRKEKYAAILVLIIGAIFITLQVLNLLSSRAHAYEFDEGKLVVNSKELYGDIRTYLTIGLCLLGSILLFFKKRTGWAMSFSILLFFSGIAGGELVSLAVLREYDGSFVLVALFLFLLLCAVLFLLLRSARKKMMVSGGTIVLTIVLLAILSGVYFFL